MKTYDIYLNGQRIKTVTGTDNQRPNDLLKKHYPKLHSCCEIKQVHQTTQPATPDWWNDLYTDAAGNCFSDADSGL
jgi:hypothetical protein